MCLTHFGYQNDYVYSFLIYFAETGLRQLSDIQLFKLAHSMSKEDLIHLCETSLKISPDRVHQEFSKDPNQYSLAIYNVLYAWFLQKQDRNQAYTDMHAALLEYGRLRDLAVKLELKEWIKNPNVSPELLTEGKLLTRIKLNTSGDTGESQRLQ